MTSAALGRSTTPFDLQPHLQGELVELRPLTQDDWDALFAVASDPLIWEQHPARDRYKQDVFRVFFREALDSGGAFAVIDKATRHIIGSTRFHIEDPSQTEVEVGWTFLARNYWGGRYNGEMKRLLLAHAFKFVQNVVFLVGPDNIRSQTALERIGGVRCGTVEKIDPDGVRRPKVKYIIRKPSGAPADSVSG